MFRHPMRGFPLDHPLPMNGVPLHRLIEYTTTELPKELIDEFAFFKTHYETLKNLHNENRKATTLLLCKHIAVSTNLLTNLATNIENALTTFIRFDTRYIKASAMHSELCILMFEVHKIAFDANIKEIKLSNSLHEKNNRFLTYQQSYMPGIVQSFVNLTINEFNTILNNEEVISPDKVKEICTITSSVLTQAIYSAEEGSLLNLQLTGMREHYFQLMQEVEALNRQCEEHTNLQDEHQEEVTHLTEVNQELEYFNREFSSRIEILADNLIELNKTLEENKELIQSLDATITQLHSEKDELTRENNILKEEIGRFKIKIAKRENVEEEKTEITPLHLEKNDLTRENNNLKEEIGRSEITTAEREEKQLKIAEQEAGQIKTSSLKSSFWQRFKPRKKMSDSSPDLDRNLCKNPT